MRIFKQSNSDTYKLSYSDNYNQSYSDLFRVSIDPRVKPEGDRKESVPEGDERGRKPEGDNFYKVTPRFCTNRNGIFELVFFTLISSTSITQAECTPTPDCASIGYTDTSCDGKFVRCPFDTSKLFCVPCDSKYKHSCSGDNITGGAGDSCGRKYVECTCSSSDYIFSNGSCICDTTCKVGAIYYSDGSCSACLHNDKTPIGVVVKDNELVVSITSKVIPWSSNPVDMSALSNIYNATTAQSDYLGKSNTNHIVSYYGENANSNASVYCYNFTPSDMEESKGQWYLPSFGEIYTYISQQYPQIEATFSNKLNSTIGHYFWSSTEVSHGYAWAIQGSTGSNYHGDKTIGHSVNCYLKI